jgi:hypothetical protein
MYKIYIRDKPIIHFTKRRRNIYFLFPAARFESALNEGEALTSCPAASPMVTVPSIFIYLKNSAKECA